MSSYISSDDLVGLDLTPPSLQDGLQPSPPRSVAESSSSTATTTSTTPSTHESTTKVPRQPAGVAAALRNIQQKQKRNAGNRLDLALDELSTSPRKQVMFCPLALLIKTAADGEKEPAVVQAQRASERQGKTRLGVRTYSLDTPNISTATSRAWRNVCAGFSSSLQPLLSPNASTHGGTCTSSRNRRDSSPEREREKTSFARSRAYSYDEETDERFTPNVRSAGLRIKLPTLATRCSSATSPCSPGGRGILKVGSPSSESEASSAWSPTARSSSSPSRRAHTFPPLSPLLSTESAQSAFSDGSLGGAPLSSSPSSTASTIPLPLLSTSPHAARAAATSPPDPTSNIGVVPVSSCCRRCSHATEYGLSPEAEYEEKWSFGAKRKRARDEKEACERTERERERNGLKSVAARNADDEDEEEDVPPTTEGFGKVVVDELQAGCKSKTATVLEDETAALGEEEVESSTTIQEGDGSTTDLSASDDAPLTPPPPPPPEVTTFAPPATPMPAIDSVVDTLSNQQASDDKTAPIRPAFTSRPSSGGTTAAVTTKGRRTSISQMLGGAGRSVLGAAGGVAAGMAGGGGRGVWA